jgi:hypothetical protein
LSFNVAPGFETFSSSASLDAVHVPFILHPKKQACRANRRAAAPSGWRQNTKKMKNRLTSSKI